MIKILAIIFVLVSICLSQQTTNQSQEGIIEGEKIVRKSREAIGIEKIVLNTIQYKVTLSTLEKMPDGKPMPSFFEEIKLTFPDKIQAIYSAEQPFPVSSTKIWNGEKYKSFYEAEFGGTKMIKDDTNSEKKEIPKSLEGKVDKNKLDALRNMPRANPKDVLIQSMWTELFPLILRHPFEQNLEFKFVGKAKANNITANVVDFKPKDGKSYRLLFDVETNYLLMMIVSYKRNDQFFTGDVETKYYLSNREKIDGVSIPKTIKVENKQTAKDKPPKISHSVSEILEFKINPELKESIFEIK